MAFRRQSIDEVARSMALVLGQSEEAEARRLAFRFIEDFDSASADERGQMVVPTPPPTGDPRYDALIAAVVELACTRHSMIAPSWVNAPDRFLSRWWFVSGMRSLHADAIAHSPISFARRGVFVTEDALTYA